MKVTINSDYLRKYANGQFEFKIDGLVCRAVKVMVIRSLKYRNRLAVNSKS